MAGSSLLRWRFLLLLSVTTLAIPAVAQQSFKVSLYKQYTLNDLGAGAGNDCWGYVSPSGREYAIVSLSNKVVFIEVTDPTNSEKFAEIAHPSSTWGDVKVFGSAVYAVTEAQGSGLQVIDMSNIDNHQVTLVKTLDSPGRTHNLSLDTVSGFLYTCGSNDGTGTTMCFDLNANPLNPVRVGTSSMTTVYQHDAQVLTYTEGPYAGRQILFGSGEDRGVEIWDVTDKSAPFLIRRIGYPFVGYCHQGWLSPDKKYWYMDDELDEYYYGLTTRTLVFDVSVLETADLVSTYSSGKQSINHNLYNRNNFIFEANYSSGLRIFNGNVDPKNPPQVGWYDTFPSDDGVDFVGAWSNYAFFPSGTVIVSDINGGAFILNVEEATRTTFNAESLTLFRGRNLGGGLPELATQDGNYVVVGKGITANASEAPIQVIVEGTCLWQDVSKLQLNLRNKVSTVGLEQTLDLYDFAANTWVTLFTGAAPTTDTDVTVHGTNPDRFVETATKKMRARLSIRQSGPVAQSDWNTSIDVLTWAVNP